MVIMTNEGGLDFHERIKIKYATVGRLPTFRSTVSRIYDEVKDAIYDYREARAYRKFCKGK